MDDVLVTGATGNVGSEVVRGLRDLGRPVRAAVRHPEKSDRDPAGLVEYVPFDFARPETHGPALRGVEKMFLVRPPQISNTRKYVNPFLEAARAAGVRHVVLISLLGAEKNPMVPHRRIEDYLRSSGVPFTFLRPNFFMQNLSTVHREDTRERGEVFVPAGRDSTSFIDVRDIAAVAVKTLTEPGHEGRVYPLTGAEAPDYYAVAGAFTEVLGKRVVYPNPAIPRFVRRMLGRGMSPGFVLVMTAIYTTARLGLAGTVTPDSARLLGRAPITMREFLRDYRGCWA
jgi:uncharacterized protein YbjT (DUF2867 family)